MRSRKTEAKSLLNNKLLFELLDTMSTKAIADWKGQSDPDKQYAIWHAVTSIDKVRNFVRRECERITSGTGTDEADE
jgi:hypothetical protein